MNNKYLIICLAATYIALSGVNAEAQEAQVRFYENGSPKKIDLPAECDNDETIVYFSNGVSGVLQNVLKGRVALETKLNAHIAKKGLTTQFGPYRTANSFAKSRGLFGSDASFFVDTVFSVAPQAYKLNRVQFMRWFKNVNSDQPESVRLAIEKAYQAANIEALRSSAPAEQFAAVYSRLLNLGRKNVVVGHSYGTILTNISYGGIEEFDRPGHVLVQTAMMDNQVEGAGRFNPYPSPYTTIEEDFVAHIYPTVDPAGNARANVENYPGDQFGSPTKGGTGHGFIDFYLDEAATGVNGQQNAHDKIMADIVAMQLRAEPRPCRGFLIGSTTSAASQKLQLSALPFSSYKKHLSSGVPVSNSGYPQTLIDWKGRYRAGVATRVLSYYGPAARYNGPGLYKNEIYRNGALAYLTPQAVVGAAIHTDSSDKEWVVIATMKSSNPFSVNRKDTVVFYRRDASITDYDSAVYDSNLKPDGWREIGERVLPRGKFVGPWFFNVDGTEAATLRPVDSIYNFSYRPMDPVCYNRTTMGESCPSGAVGAFPAGNQTIDEYKVFTQQIPTNSANSTPGTTIEESGSPRNLGLLAVDYNSSGMLLLKERNILPERGSLSKPDIAASNFTWLEINGSPITPNGIMECSVNGGEVCRSTFSAGLSSKTGGFFAIIGDNKNFSLKDRNGYHIFFMDLRTKTYAFSKQEGNSSTAGYYFVHKGVRTPIGTTTGNKVSLQIATSSRYGYEGSYWNIGPETTLFDYRLTTPKEETALKVNPILGIMRMDESVLSQVVPEAPARFGVKVNTDESALISVVLPDGQVFSYHTGGMNLGALTGINTSAEPLLPMAIR